jgi:hypothetical protein
MADATGPMAIVRNYIDAFNKSDAKAMAAAFAPQSSILDGMAPHLWVEPTASQDWYRDVLAEGEQHGALGYHVALDEPRQANVTGDAAYVVVPATIVFKPARKAGHPTWRCLHSGSPKARGRLAHCGMSVGQRTSCLSRTGYPIQGHGPRK